MTSKRQQLAERANLRGLWGQSRDKGLFLSSGDTIHHLSSAGFGHPEVVFHIYSLLNKVFTAQGEIDHPVNKSTKPRSCGRII